MKRKHIPYMGNRTRIERINRMKQIDAEIDSVLPNTYAAIALALFRNGVTAEQITDIFAESQRIWEEARMERRSVADLCYEEADIDCRS